jgi:hypothetical protein
MDNAKQFKLRDSIQNQDMKHKKQLHDKVFRFKCTQKFNKVSCLFQTEKAAFNKFEERMNDYKNTVDKNEMLLKRLKEKESEYMEKFNRTLERQKTVSKTGSNGLL